MSRIEFKKKSLFGVVFVVSLVVAVVMNCLSCRSVLAVTGAWIGDGGGSGSGGGGGGSTCNASENKYRIDCAGASWIYYRATSITSDDVSFPYLKIKGAVKATINHVCSEIGGFWHFGVNANGTYINGGTLANSESSGWYGHWVTLDRSVQSNYKNPPLNSTFLRQTIGGVYEADHYGTESEVLVAYKRAAKIATGSEPSSLPSNVWGFCSNEDPEPEYRAASNVSIRNSDWSVPGESSESTGLVAYGTKQVTAEATYNIGDTVRVAFTHQIFSSEIESSKSWWIAGCEWENSTSYTLGSGSTQSWLPNDCSSTYKHIIDNGSSAIATGSGFAGFYTTNPNSVHTDTLIMTFNREGTWVFCENIENYNGDVTTSACAEIHINPAPVSEYTNKSNVSIQRSDGVDDVEFRSASGQSMEKASKTYHTNQKIKIVFSHEIFSSRSDGSTHQWEVAGKRWEDLWGSGDYYVYSGGDFKDDEIIDSGNAVLNTSRGGLYSTGSQYVLRREHEISFNNPGLWTYCETLRFEGSGSTVCAEIRVEEPPHCVGSCTYFAKSNVAIREYSNDNTHFNTTGITNSGSVDVEKENVDKGSGHAIDIVFSHNIYSDTQANGISYSINRGSISGSDYQLVGTPVTCGDSNGSANFSINDGNSFGYLAGDPRNCSDGANPYIARDVYTLYFTSDQGHVEICQTVSVNSVTKTTVCAKASAKREPTPCSTWQDYRYNDSAAESARTYVVAKIKNSSVSALGDWSDSVYAKPNDEIDWIYCYFPGVQRAYNTLATTNHISESNGHPDYSYSLEYAKLSNSHFGIWQNEFSLSRQGDFSPKFNNLRANGTLGDDTILFYETASGDSNGNLNANRGSTTYTIEYGSNKNKAGKTLTGKITSGIPTSVGAQHLGPHSWGCHWGKSCSTCGSYQCNCVTTCSGSGESRSCSTSCSTCCYSCWLDTCSHSGDYISNSRSNTQAIDIASVMIPYNFTNSAVVNLDNGVVYAGETKKLNDIDGFRVTVSSKYNGTTRGTYATQVDDAKLKLVSFVANSNREDTDSYMVNVGSGKDYNICNAINSTVRCKEIDSEDGVTLNPSGKLDENTKDYKTSYFDSSYNVYDENAGMYFCVVAAVYPYTSGGSTNLNSAGDNRWFVSKPSCRVISKRPTFQVRGGSIYSNGSINTSAIVKNNLKDDTSNWPYNDVYRSNTKRKVFSSWAEQSVILGGVTGSFASGAATNKKITVDASGTKNVQYGSEEGKADYCIYRTPLSFANYNDNGGCPNTQQTGNSGITVSKNKDSIINYWWPLDTVETSTDSVNLGQDSNYTETKNLAGDDILDIHRNGDLTINGGSISYGGVGSSKALPRIVRSEGNITISGNIKYEIASGETISSSEMIPKLIIYAKENINIQCNVTRIDAILITEKTVDTCSNGGSESNAARSNQLTINGAILANQVQLNRTFGASTGKYSGIPAEIINYDTSFILWGRTVSEADDFQTYSTVYQQELAPRY